MLGLGGDGEEEADGGCWKPDLGSARRRAANSSRDDMLVFEAAVGTDLLEGV